MAQHLTKKKLWYGNQSSLEELFNFSKNSSSQQQLTEKNYDISRYSELFSMYGKWWSAVRGDLAKAAPASPPLCTGRVPLLDKGTHYGINSGEI